MNDNKGFQFLGLVMILGAGAFAIRVLNDAMREESFINFLSQYSPWLSSNAISLSYISAVLLMLLLLMIPPMLMKEANSGETDKMELLGAAGFYLIVGVLGIVSVSYLAGMGWIAATT